MGASAAASLKLSVGPELVATRLAELVPFTKGPIMCTGCKARKRGLAYAWYSADFPSDAQC